MDVAWDFSTLEAAGVCMGQASRFLYCEPDVDELAEQVASSQFKGAPFGTDDSFVQKGLILLDSWCTAAAAEAGESQMTANFLA